MSANYSEADEAITDEQKNNSVDEQTPDTGIKSSTSSEADKVFTHEEPNAPIEHISDCGKEIYDETHNSVDACKDNKVPISAKSPNTDLDSSKENEEELSNIKLDIQEIKNEDFKCSTNMRSSIELKNVENSIDNINNIILEESHESSNEAELAIQRNSDIDLKEASLLENPISEEESISNNDSNTAYESHNNEQVLINQENNTSDNKHIEAISNKCENHQTVDMEESLKDHLSIENSKASIYDANIEQEDNLNIKYDSYDDSTHNRSESPTELSTISKDRKDLEDVLMESDTQDSNNEDLELRWEDDDDELEEAKVELNDRLNKGSSDSHAISLEFESNNIDEDDLLQQSVNTTMTSNTSYLPLIEHGLNKPDVMLEIPNQDLSEFSDEDNDDPNELEANMSPDMADMPVLNTTNKLDDEKAPMKMEYDVPVHEDTENTSNNVLSVFTNEKETKNKNENCIETYSIDDNKLLGVDQDSNEKAYKNSDKINEAETEMLETDSSSTLEKNIQKIPSSKFEEPQPSTSAQHNEHNALENIPQDSDVVEMSDSLGLLAESSRVMDDEEEQEQEDDEDGEDDDMFEVDDDNSNLMTAEHSEDSNAHHSEAESREMKDDTPSASDKETSRDGMVLTEAETVSEEDNIDQIETEETVLEDTQKELENITVDQAEVCQEAEVCLESEVCDEAEVCLEGEVCQETEDVQKEAETPMDIETVKLSDTSDVETDIEKEETNLSGKTAENADIEVLEITEEDTPEVTSETVNKQNKNVVDCVYLEGSSSDDEEICEVDKRTSKTASVPAAAPNAGDVTETAKKLGGAKEKAVTLNSSEVTIKMTKAAKDSPRAAPDTKDKPVGGLEVFTLDSDEEEPASAEKEIAPSEPEKSGAAQPGVRCVNKKCGSGPTAQYAVADARVIAFYGGDKKRRSCVCEDCYAAVELRNQKLVAGVRSFQPLLELELGSLHDELVEISDSESEDEAPPRAEDDLIGDEAAKFLEDNLTDTFNEMWKKFKMDDQLRDTQAMLQEELNRLEKESCEIDAIFKDCQVATDKLRNELYATFEPPKHELPPVTIFDAIDNRPIAPQNEFNVPETRQSKRRSSTASEPPAKRPAIPLGYAPLNTSPQADAISSPSPAQKADKMDDDNTEISVVKLSVEAAPADLPAPGPLHRAPLRQGMLVYAKKKASWVKATIVEIYPKNAIEAFLSCRVMFEHRGTKEPYATISSRCLAYYYPPEARMIIGTRVIATFKEPGLKEAFSAGIVAEIPNPVNNYRYLIFFDDGYAQYAAHAETRLVCECSPLVWEEVHPDSRQFVKDYINSYPERPMVRLHAGQNLKTEYRGKWWTSVVELVDASLVRVVFRESRRREWIYRGSTRLAPLYRELQAAERTRPRALPRAQPTAKGNVPYVEYTRSNEQANKPAEPAKPTPSTEARQQRSVAKKSTASSQPAPAPAGNLDNVTSRVVFYTPKNAVKPHKMVPHKCGPQCKRTDVLGLKDLRTYNPLAKPLLSGWERQVVRWKGNKEVMYVGGCGRRLRNMEELHRYLRATGSDLSVDLFDFSPHTHCLAEFVLNKCIVAKKDLSHGKENVPVPCVNYYDELLPEFCSYNTERTPTAGVPLNLDPDFLCGCDCEDDCEDKSKCACWQLTLEGARTIRMDEDVGYVYKRLPKPLPSGIYECNSRCKCKHTCLNRVAQHPLQLKLQVFKTMNRGWGIRALNDVPEGAFLCVYAGNLLTDATANLDGLNEGDEYLAELDYIEVVEQMKEGYEDDIPKDIKKLDKKELAQVESEEESSSSSEEEEPKSKEEDDDDFQPGYLGAGVLDFTKRLRQRDKNKDKENKNKETDKKENQKDKEEKSGNGDEECITISDDESREPSCFTAAAGMGGSDFVSKYRSVRTLFGEDEACYIMDAKVQGNIGRYLNHSCSPNVFVQNVFVDTHDPRFPWVAFFALTHIRAGTELTWNYNYDVGSVPGKTLYCYCGAPNCRGRLL